MHRLSKHVYVFVCARGHIGVSHQQPGSHMIQLYKTRGLYSRLTTATQHTATSAGLSAICCCRLPNQPCSVLPVRHKLLSSL